MGIAGADNLRHEPWCASSHSFFSEYGFSKRDVAQIAKTTIPDLRQWSGELASLSESSVQLVAGLLSACKLLESQCEVEDASGWFETPVHAEAPVTPLSIFAEGYVNLVFLLST